MAGSEELLRVLSVYKYEEDKSLKPGTFVRPKKSSVPIKHSAKKVTIEKNHKVYRLPSLNPSLKRGLKVVFIGFNPGIESSRLQHHYAHKSNRFWKLFNECHILSKATDGNSSQQCSAADDYELINFNIGFTDLVLRPTKSADDLPLSEMIDNVPRLIGELNTFKPKIACFVGKGVWEKVLIYNNSKPKIKEFQWGLQPATLNKLVNISHEVIIFVMPSTSGLVSISHNIKKQLWEDLAELL